VAGSGCVLFRHPDTGDLLGGFHPVFEPEDFPAAVALPLVSEAQAMAAVETSGLVEPHHAVTRHGTVYSTQFRAFVAAVALEPRIELVPEERRSDPQVLDTVSVLVDAVNAEILAVERFQLNAEIRGRTGASLPGRLGTALSHAPSWRAVPHVPLRYEHPQLVAPATAVSDEEGAFVFAEVPEGGTVVALHAGETVEILEEAVRGHDGTLGSAADAREGAPAVVDLVPPFPPRNRHG
jgi:hypothetical protein